MYEQLYGTTSDTWIKREWVCLLRQYTTFYQYQSTWNCGRFKKSNWCNACRKIASLKQSLWLWVFPKSYVLRHNQVLQIISEMTKRWCETANKFYIENNWWILSKKDIVKELFFQIGTILHCLIAAKMRSLLWF